MSAIIFIKNVNYAQKYAFKLIWENKRVSIKKCSQSVPFNGSCVSLIISEGKKRPCKESITTFAERKISVCQKM